MTAENHKLVRRRKLVGAMRVITLVVGLYQFIFGERNIGFCILLSLVAITAPSLVTRGRVRALPLEFEFSLFIMVMLQLVIGETLNFYDNVPYYDKLVHFTLPFFLGYLTSLLAYTMYATGNLKATVFPAVVIIVLVSLGIGALWEIWEYFSDVFLGTYLQGSLTADPLVDTMNDLIVDTLGGIFGALLAVRFVRSEAKADHSRLPELTREIAEDFGGQKQN
jgi:hypothetical protein